MPLLLDDTRVRLMRTAYVVYHHTSLEKAHKFLVDFGLKKVEEDLKQQRAWYAGYGNDPFCYVAVRSKDGTAAFGGAAYIVESRDELTKASKILGATAILPAEGPGGGEVVTLVDPLGFKIFLVHGQTEKVVENLDLEKLTVNFEDEKPRRGRFQRLKPGPAPVHKWGHYGVTYSEGDFQTMFDWYTKNLSLAPSDIISHQGRPVTAFLHIDRGLDHTDHHSFFFKKAKPGAGPGVAHAAFEVHDFDIQQLGHQHLMGQGHKLCWGVGRHVLGSQIFDYWFAPDDFVVEHYADGDLVNSETTVAHLEGGQDLLSVWGPPVPSVF